MSIDKPEIPSVELPETWGGTQTPYNESQIANGYEEAVPQIVDGGNVNYEKRGLFENVKYLRTVADSIVNMPIGKVLTVDDNNKLAYETQIRDDTVVHIDGEETITGKKTFETTNDSTLEVKATTIDSETIPTSDKAQFLARFFDKNNVPIGDILSFVGSNGENQIRIQARRLIDGNWVYAPINCGVNSNGEAYVAGITVSNTSNSSSLATTAWVKNILKASGVGLATISLGQNGYCQFTNGLLIQWGKTAKFTGGTAVTITLPKPYANSNYSIQVSTQPQDDENNSSRVMTPSKTVYSTKFNIYANGFSSNYVGACAYWFTIGKGA